MEKKNMMERLIFACIRPGGRDPYYVVCPRCRADATAEVVYHANPDGEATHSWKFECEMCGFVKVGNFGFWDEMLSVVSFGAFMAVLCAAAYRFYPDTITSTPALLLIIFAACIFVIGGMIHLLCVQKIIENGLVDEDGTK